jgi:hypothetical protein
LVAQNSPIERTDNKQHVRERTSKTSTLSTIDFSGTYWATGDSTSISLRIRTINYPSIVGRQQELGNRDGK